MPMRKYAVFLWMIMVSGFMFAPVQMAFAQTSTPTVTAPSPKTVQLPDPLGGADLPTIIGRVISTFLGIVGGLALLVFVYAGIRYMTAAGDEKAITTAKDTMVYGFIGLLIIVFAYAITNFFFRAVLG
jgi:type IV secretion system pilin